MSETEDQRERSCAEKEVLKPTSGPSFFKPGAVWGGSSSME